MKEYIAENVSGLVFDEPTRFERCNIRHCTFNVKCQFDRCNIIECEKTENCECDKSNIINDEDDPFGEKRERNFKVIQGGTSEDDTSSEE